jgi:putative FmdB family regulatory protein
MPIYAYKCASCGHAKDVLQKISDPQLTVCPACGAATFQKQVTAGAEVEPPLKSPPALAGFQLKGSGWYATDFKGGSTSAPAVTGEGAKAPAEPAKAGGDSAPKPATDSAAKPAPAAPAAGKSDAPKAVAGGCGPSRAGH